MSTNRIAIVGGGPGGLTLARILQKHGIRATVYELESSPNARFQGGSFDLHQESGLQALKEADLYSEFLKLARYEGQQMRVLDKNGVVHLDEDEMGPPPEEGDHHERPEIDRVQLRQILLDSLDEGTIKWGHKVKSVIPLSTSQHKLVFENGSEDTFDLVIGADGAWSILRPLVSPAKPIYSGISFIDLTLTSVDTRYPAITSIVGQGTTFVISDNKGLFLKRNSRGRVRVYVGVREPENWLDTYEGGVFANIETCHAEKAKEHIVNIFPGWDASILDSIQYADPNSIVARKIYALPYPHTWESKAGITLLGDAAHLMSPFAGEGVNLAMIDAMDLALTIVKSGVAAEGIEAFEKKMSERGAEMAKECAENIELMFTPDAPKPFLDQIAFLMSQGGSSGGPPEGH